MGTTTTTSSTTAASRGENAITGTGTLAVLPPVVLWAASLAASRDSAKGVLCSVDVRRTADGQIRVSATDGHRCLRVVFPQCEHFYLNSEQTEPIRLNPETFSKQPTAKACYVALDASGLATFSDRLHRPTGAGAWGAETHANAIGQQFPNIDQLWPEDRVLTCDPGELVAMNAGFLGDVCKIASKLSPNSVLRFLTTKRAVAPLIVRCELEGSWLMRENAGTKYIAVFKGEPVWVEYLLMPVQIRK